MQLSAQVALVSFAPFFAEKGKEGYDQFARQIAKQVRSIDRQIEGIYNHKLENEVKQSNSLDAISELSKAAVVNAEMKGKRKPKPVRK